MQRVVLPATAKTLADELRRSLLLAADEGVLRTAPDVIFRLIKTEERKRDRETVVAAVLGGATFDKGQADGSFFVRSDGARLSFGVTVVYQRRSDPELVTYRFHLRFPRGRSPLFIRFDLNDESRDPVLEPRSHLHPGSDDIRIPVPMMAPIEILERLLYAIPTP